MPIKIALILSIILQFAAAIIALSLTKRTKTNIAWWLISIGFLLMAYDIFACGVVAPCFVGLLIFPFRRIDGRLACAAMLAGGVLGAAAALTGNSIYNYIGMSVSGLLALACSRKRCKTIVSIS